MNGIRMQLDEKPIRFTPDGKVSVIDTIEVLASVPDAESTWKELSEIHAELLPHCSTHRFSEDAPVTVIDNEGLQRLQELLFEHMVEAEA